MIKILVYGLTPNIGGLETYIIYQFRAFDKSLIHMDFINEYKNSTVAFNDEIISSGSNIYNLHNFKIWYKFLKKHKNEYDIIIFNTVNPFILYMLEAVKLLGGFGRIIIHSHNGGIDTFNFIKKISYPAFLVERIRFKLIGAEKWACSEIAAKWMFGTTKNCTIIKNGIETEAFRYRQDVRIKIRSSLSFSSADFVIGHIGRFADQKNHIFLIDIFNEISKRLPNAKLLLIGAPVDDGKIERKVRAKVNNLNLNDKVFFLGLRKDTADLYQAMDLFLLPSLYEGLPVVGIEAQCAGLPILFSDKITKEVKINDNVFFLPIDNAVVWADKVVSLHEKSSNRENAYMNIIKHGFDVKMEAKRVEKLLTNI